jgi:hypothetical protein
MMSGTMVVVHCMRMGVEIQLQLGKVWRGPSNTFDCRIEVC